MMKITIEGPQGCGKTGLAKKMALWLENQLDESGSRRRVLVADENGTLLPNTKPDIKSIVICTKQAPKGVNIHYYRAPYDRKAKFHVLAPEA